MPALTLAEAQTHVITKTLLQQSSISGIKVSISKKMWEGALDAAAYAQLADVVTGECFRWTNKQEVSLSIDWTDERETESLRQLLQPELGFKLPRAALLRVSAARPRPAWAAPPMVLQPMRRPRSPWTSRTNQRTRGTAKSKSGSMRRARRC
jgi:hypothetical protein